MSHHSQSQTSLPSSNLPSKVSLSFLGTKYPYQLISTPELKSPVDTHLESCLTSKQTEPDSISLAKNSGQIKVNSCESSQFNYKEYLPKHVDKFGDQSDEDCSQAHQYGYENKAKRQAPILQPTQRGIKNENEKGRKSMCIQILENDEQNGPKIKAPKKSVNIDKLIEIEEREYLANKCQSKVSILKPSGRVQQYVNGNATTRIKVISKTQQEYQRQKKYLRKDYEMKNMSQQKVTHNQNIRNNQSLANKSDNQGETNWVSKETLEQFKKKLGFIKRSSHNDNDGAKVMMERGRSFIPAPQQVRKPKKIHEYPPTCMVPEYGRFNWPPKMSEHRVWRRQMKESNQFQYILQNQLLSEIAHLFKQSISNFVPFALQCWQSFAPIFNQPPFDIGLIADMQPQYLNLINEFVVQFPLEYPHSD